MALGRQRDRQSEMLVSWAEMPRSPGHVFYDRLQSALVAAGFLVIVCGDEDVNNLDHAIPVAVEFDTGGILERAVEA